MDYSPLFANDSEIFSAASESASDVTSAGVDGKHMAFKESA